MGDRTYVSLTVLTAQADAARELFDDGANEESTDGNLTVFGFEEVNYGNLECESDLTEAGIAWDKTWSAGGDYAAGREHVRYQPDGTVQHLEIYEDAEGPDLGELLKRCDDPAELVRYIRQYKADITPLPWEGQIEAGKMYTANQ